MPLAEARTQLVRTRVGALAQFSSSAELSGLTLRRKCEPTAQHRQLKEEAAHFTVLLTEVSPYGSRLSGGEIIYRTNCSRWGTAEQLQALLIDSVDELRPSRIKGHMDTSGGRKRPYGHMPVDENLGGVSQQRSEILIEILPHNDQLIIRVSSPSANALAGCWHQVMQRLGVPVPAPKNWTYRRRDANTRR
jgi:hypothetical protein